MRELRRRAQRRLYAEEKRRGELVRVYYQHHGTWPQSTFIDDILAVLERDHG